MGVGFSGVECMNEILKQICDEDQEDLRTLPQDRLQRSRERINRVRHILAAGGAKEGLDYAHAAVVLQHGEILDEWWQAHESAKKAIELGFEKAKWLAAATLDRWLVHQGKPLKYGVQRIPFCGIYRLPAIDPSTTDEDRASLSVPDLSKLLWFDGTGLPPHEIFESVSNDSLQIDVIRLSRSLKFAPDVEGLPSGEYFHDRPVYSNTYGWRWVFRDGDIETGWLRIPCAPRLAHMIVGGSEPAFETTSFCGNSAIWVKIDNSITLYVQSKNDYVWSITGRYKSEVLGVMSSLH
jgi:hypothetical protein